MPAAVAPLLLVDAPHLLFRSYFALPKTITDDKDRPVNALLGSVNMLVRMVSEHEPRAVMLCFGPDSAEYRVELYPDYHADREPVPDDLDYQFGVAPELFEAFRLVHRRERAARGRRPAGLVCLDRSQRPVVER